MQGLGAPEDLRTEYLVDPLGLGTTQPRFSWLSGHVRAGSRQVAYRLIVSSDPARLDRDDGDVWDTGRVQSGVTAQVEFAGRPLVSRERCWWKVMTWDADGAPSRWSATATFELALLSLLDWDAGMRGPTPIASRVRGDENTSAPVPYMRRTFHVSGEVTTARLYIGAFGSVRAHLNGRRVGRDELAPGWVDYGRRLPYRTYDVTDLVHDGENVLGAQLGDGWYCGFVGGTRQRWGDRPRLVARLEVQRAGEAPIVVDTDEQWRTATGAILSSDHYMGEVYDARSEHAGWSEAGFDDHDWQPVVTLASSFAMGTELEPAVGPPVRAMRELSPVGITEVDSGVCRADFGQNLVGRVRLRLAGLREGDEVVVRHAEMLEDDDSLHTANLRDARSTDVFVADGGGIVEYEPAFTFHGFRYVEVSGLRTAISATDVTAVVLHVDAPEVGSFSCSNELVNRLHENIVWSQRGNFLDVPTDCPQRDERLGWTGDIQVFARTASYNMDVARFLTKYLADLRDSQLVAGVERGQFPWTAPRVTAHGGGPAWADAAVVIPWLLYQRYGDTRVLRDHYPALLLWLDFLERHADGRTPGTWPGFGDWLALDSPETADSGLEAMLGGTPRDYLWEAFRIRALDLVACMAEVLGRPSDTARCADTAARLRDDVRRTWIEDRRLRVETQTAAALAIEFELLSDAEDRAGVTRWLVEEIEQRGHLTTGFVGTPHVLHALTKIDRVDLAYLLLERTDHPGWLYPVTQGATTIWERWDSWTREGGFNSHGMNSFNHYAYGAVGDWLHGVVLGLDLTHVEGVPQLTIAPRPGGSLTWARGHWMTILGRVDVSWVRDDDRVVLDVEVPPNASATLRLPIPDVNQVTVSGVGPRDGDGLADLVTNDGGITCSIGGGSHRFEWTVVPDA